MATLDPSANPPSRPRTGTFLHRFAERTERLSGVDGLADRLAGTVDRGVRRARAKDFLSGTWLGHPLHPLATDAVIGAWSMAAVLDAGCDDRFGDAADRLVGLGVLAALPTAASGLSDWADMTEERSRRMGVVHAAANATALIVNTASYAARKAGRRDLGRRLTWASGLPLMVGGFLGSHMAYARGIGVSRTLFDERIPDWTAAAASEPLRTDWSETEVDGAPLLARLADGGEAVAVSGTCTHCGARLAPDAKRAVRCVADGSVFRATDGAVLAGPATTPLPRFEVRVDPEGLKVRSPA